MAAKEHKDRRAQMRESLNGSFENSVYRLCGAQIRGGYRYYLRGEILNARSERHLVVVQLNPSKASGGRSDATAGKVCNWAGRNDFAVVHFLNLFARIATIQSAINMNTPYEELVGLENNHFLEDVLRSIPKNSRVVFAYGQPLGVLFNFHSKRVSEIEEILKQHRVTEVFRVGPLSNGRYPRHGRAWNKNVGLETFDFQPVTQN